MAGRDTEVKIYTPSSRNWFSGVGYGADSVVETHSVEKQIPTPVRLFFVYPPLSHRPKLSNFSFLICRNELVMPCFEDMPWALRVIGKGWHITSGVTMVMTRTNHFNGKWVVLRAWRKRPLRSLGSLGEGSEEKGMDKTFEHPCEHGGQCRSGVKNRVCGMVKKEGERCWWEGERKGSSRNNILRIVKRRTGWQGHSCEQVDFVELLGRITGDV